MVDWVERKREKTLTETKLYNIKTNIQLIFIIEKKKPEDWIESYVGGAAQWISRKSREMLQSPFRPNCINGLAYNTVAL